VSEDPEKTWQEIAPYCYNDVAMYSKFTKEASSVSSPYSPFDPSATSVDVVKETGIYRVMTPDECVEYCKDLESHGYSLIVSPQVGGLPPKIGWEGLELLVDKVLPALT
jgi:hypothetical protein